MSRPNRSERSIQRAKCHRPAEQPRPYPNKNHRSWLLPTAWNEPTRSKSSLREMKTIKQRDHRNSHRKRSHRLWVGLRVAKNRSFSRSRPYQSKVRILLKTMRKLKASSIWTTKLCNRLCVRVRTVRDRWRRPGKTVTNLSAPIDQ